MKILTLTKPTELLTEALLREMFEEEEQQQPKEMKPTEPLNPEDTKANNEREQEQDVVLTPEDLSLMNSLRAGIEREINNSLDEFAEQEPISEDLDENLEEGASDGGFAYESTVLKAIRKAGLTGNIKKGAGASAAAADADIKLPTGIFNIEVKLDKNAQMGGSSIRFGKGGIQIVKPMEPETVTILQAAVKKKSPDIKKMLAFIQKKSPKAVNGNVTGFPLTCTRDAWESASAKGYLVNTRIRYTTEFIAKHYAKKGIYYIQIGGSGLFYLGKNPAKLPIPRLTGDIDIEIRSARSGSKPLKSGVEVVGGGIRVQARLKTKGKSPYTLDNPASIQEMIKAVRANKRPTVAR